MAGAVTVGSRVLVFRVASIGDMVVAVPALRAFRSAAAPSRVVLLSDDRSVRTGFGGPALLTDPGLIDETITEAGWRRPLALLRLILRIRRQHFDVVLYLPPRERTRFAIRRDRLFFRLCGIRRIVGPSEPRLTRAGFTVKPLARVNHEAEDLLDVLRRDGIPAAPLSSRDFDLGLRDGEHRAAAAALQRAGAGRGPFIGVAAGAKMPSKRWPSDSFERALRRISGELGLTPVFVGGADERAETNRLVGRLGVGVNVCGDLSVRESAALLQQCRMFVGNDSGPMHLAYACGTPCVAVFSAQDLPGRWEPFGVPSRVLRTVIECAGCQLSLCPRDNECLRAISADQVVDACRAVCATTKVPLT